MVVIFVIFPIYIPMLYIIAFKNGLFIYPKQPFGGKTSAATTKNLTSSRGDGHGDRRLMAVGFFLLSSFEVIFFPISNLKDLCHWRWEEVRWARNPRDFCSWSSPKSLHSAYIPSLRIQSPCQMLIGVYNHLLRKAFRFHYHSQKVIGSLVTTPKNGNMNQLEWQMNHIMNHINHIPIASGTGIFPYMYHKNQLNVGKYTMHGWYGI